MAGRGSVAVRRDEDRGGGLRAGPARDDEAMRFLDHDAMTRAFVSVRRFRMR
jgi:hypothetical protein